MKQPIALLLLILLGCRLSDSDKVAPQSLLRTWRLVQVSNTMFPADNAFLVQFKPEGQLLYGASKERGGCCDPENFSVQANQIQFFSASPLPGICAQVLCRRTYLTVGVGWKIEALTEQRLTLTNEISALNFSAL